MTDLVERRREREAAGGDASAYLKVQRQRHRRGLHEWVHLKNLKNALAKPADRCGCYPGRHGCDFVACALCGLFKVHYEEIRRVEKYRREREAKRAAAEIRCRQQDTHDWVPGDETAEDCGCPSDPGIHGCHPRYCSVCLISEEEWTEAQ